MEEEREWNCPTLSTSEADEKTGLNLHLPYYRTVKRVKFRGLGGRYCKLCNHRAPGGFPIPPSTPVPWICQFPSLSLPSLFLFLRLATSILSTHTHSLTHTHTHSHSLTHPSLPLPLPPFLTSIPIPFHSHPSPPASPPCCSN